jgi:hypothetical protein
MARAAMHRPQLTFIGLVLFIAPGCVFDSERRPLVDVDVAAASAYVFRGQTFTEQPVAQVDTLLQLPAKGGGAVSVGGFGNLDLDDSIGDAWAAEGHRGEFTQMDLWLGYGRRFGAVDVALGVRYYSWPYGDDFRFAPFPSTSEVFARVGRDVLGFDTSLSVHHDFDEVHSLYARGQVARTFELRHDLHLESALWLGWSDAAHSEWLYRTRVDALADLGASLGLRLDLDAVTSARLGVAGSTILDSELRDWFEPRIDADVVWATASIGWAF